MILDDPYTEPEYVDRRPGGDERVRRIFRWRAELPRGTTTPSPARRMLFSPMAKQHEDSIHTPTPNSWSRINSPGVSVKAKTHEDFLKTPKPAATHRTEVFDTTVTYVLSKRRAYVTSFRLPHGTIFRDDIENSYRMIQDLAERSSRLYDALSPFEEHDDARLLTAQLGKEIDKWVAHKFSLELAMATIAQAETSGHPPIIGDFMDLQAYKRNVAKVERAPLELALRIAQHRPSTSHPFISYTQLNKVAEIIAAAEGLVLELALMGMDEAPASGSSQVGDGDSFSDDSGKKHSLLQRLLGFGWGN
ncbi:hypothetical protein CC85DRAFT_301816 [Cutaneotrichosporon oleaginosum]|uniref:Uncharacterized protein n=1 Tax=Cutaneotrichosporon oleaginosum TaxID=879819 RepID=A0A0J0XPJ2_9TREE|nr:uncharacterized protein CC85DRAFT_301816 [Cutaneotrichosporon oleaginosum]KLT43031.1 hypothetical protein CC85DRAFT_301816 [Cutaneotrichosporon oleaginosum]TXT11767.1 hypothetical protein COLE_02177 [Cutaneotrichosporon oleaginosum]